MTASNPALDALLVRVAAALKTAGLTDKRRYRDLETVTRTCPASGETVHFVNLWVARSLGTDHVIAALAAANLTAEKNAWWVEVHLSANP